MGHPTSIGEKKEKKEKDDYYFKNIQFEIELSSRDKVGLFFLGITWILFFLGEEYGKRSGRIDFIILNRTFIFTYERFLILSSVFFRIE